MSIRLPTERNETRDGHERLRHRDRAVAAEAASPYGAFRRLQRGKCGPAVGVAVVGCGYWGPNMVRNFAELDAARVVAVSDLSVERLTALSEGKVDDRLRRHPLRS